MEKLFNDNPHLNEIKEWFLAQLGNCEAASITGEDDLYVMYANALCTVLNWD